MKTRMRIRARKLKYWLWANTRENRPDRRGDAWADRIAAINAETRADREHAADDQHPHLPVTTVHRPAIYVDADGRTVVRDRYGISITETAPAGAVSGARVIAPAGAHQTSSGTTETENRS